MQNALFAILQRIQQLSENIETSKMAVRHLLNQIRQQGHVYVIDNTKKIEQNPNKNEESAENVYVISPQENPVEKLYPTTRIDTQFDIEHRNEILSKDHQFKNRMSKSINNSSYYDLSETIVWKVSDYLNSLQYIKTIINKFQSIYNQKKFTDILDQDFMANTNPSQFIVNGNVLYSNDNITMMKELKRLIPYESFQKLIATYANQNILNDVLSHLPVICPVLQKYDFKNSRNIFKINNLDHGLMKIVITNISDLKVKNKQLTQENRSCGVRATVIVSPVHAPIIKYSYFVE